MQVGQWTLVDEKTNSKINIGDLITSFRGEVRECLGGCPPHKPGSSGYVYVNGNARYYVGVYGLKWILEV